jgi:hypothetical protein
VRISTADFVNETINCEREEKGTEQNRNRTERNRIEQKGEEKK